jgi:serine protease Do
VHTGIGFAIPSNLAKEVADQLIARGKFTRAWLGIGIRTLQEDAESRTLMMGVDDGVIVASIVPNGPAARSDLQTNDVITAVDDRRVSTAQQLKDEIRQKPVGQPVTLAVVRNGKDLRVKVRPGEWGEEQVMASARRNVARTTDASGLGLTVQALTGDLAEKYAVKMREGVIVTAVEKGSLAARQGIRPGDIITEVSQQPVTTPAHFREALKKADIKKGVSLNLIRADASRSEVLKEAE